MFKVGHPCSELKYLTQEIGVTENDNRKIKNNPKIQKKKKKNQFRYITK